jgi:hypothetical protein
MAAVPAEASALKRPVRRIGLRRTARGARADLVLAAGTGIERVHARLARRGATIAVAAGEARARRATLRFRGTPDLAPGRYTVHLVLVDGDGRSVVRRRRVTLA